VGQWEDFSRVCEWDRPFTWGVEHGKEIDEQCHQPQVDFKVYGNQRAESGSQERPRHVGKREEEQCSSPKRVNGPECRERKKEVDKTEAPRSPQCLILIKARRHEDCGGVECDDVDTAHLLRNHDSERGKGRAANSRNGEELDKASYVVALADDGRLNFELFMDVIEIASCLERAVAKSQ
jgi:hypothetical protein